VHLVGFRYKNNLFFKYRLGELHKPKNYCGTAGFDSKLYFYFRIYYIFPLSTKRLGLVYINIFFHFRLLMFHLFYISQF